MTTTEADLLRDVLASLEDDFPRLKLADWYDERGQPERAEFIRVQCEIARLSSYAPTPVTGRNVFWAHINYEPGDPRRRLALRQVELLATPAGTAFRPACCYGFPCQIGWCRGFVESVGCSLPDWLDHAEALLAGLPLREALLRLSLAQVEVAHIPGIIDHDEYRCLVKGSQAHLSCDILIPLASYPHTPLPELHRQKLIQCLHEYHSSHPDLRFDLTIDP